MKHPRRRASRSEPDHMHARGGNAGPAGGKSAFIRQSRRHDSRMERVPGLAIRGDDQGKSAIHRIANRDAVLLVPKGKAVVEGFGVVIGKLKSPVLPGIGGFVDARLLARSDAQRKSRAFAESLNIAEVQLLRAF